MPLVDPRIVLSEAYADDERLGPVFEAGDLVTDTDSKSGPVRV